MALFDGCTSCGELRDGQANCRGCGTRRDPITPEQLAREREASVQHLGLLMQTMGPFKFTCDTCSHAPLCLYAFDAYNVDGDCLASK